MIKIFSTPTCHYCKKSEEIMNLKEIPYEKYDVSEDMAALVRMKQATNQMSVPVFEIDGKWIVGYADFMAWLAGQSKSS